MVTHRDPVAVVVSMATMIAYTARMHASPVDPARIGRAWADRIDAMLSACARDRDVLARDRSLDLRFDDFMADDVAAARRVLEVAGQTFTDDLAEAMRSYVSSHPRGRLGAIDYRAADVGLDVDDLRARFAPYIDRFL